MRIALVLIAGSSLFVLGVAVGSKHPGLAPASISALQWSAVEIDKRAQAMLGNRVDVQVVCADVRPPSTVVCTLFPRKAGDVRSMQQAARVVQHVFAEYQRERGYAWLELSLKEPDALPEALRIDLELVDRK